MCRLGSFCNDDVNDLSDSVLLYHPSINMTYMMEKIIIYVWYGRVLYNACPFVIYFAR